MGFAVSASFTERGIAARRSSQEASAAHWFSKANDALEAIQARSRAPAPSSVVNRVIRRFTGVKGVTRAEILGSTRRVDVVLVRQAIAYWARRTTGRSLPEIGHYLGRDHTTVLHAVQVYPAKRAAMGRHVRSLYPMEEKA